MSRETIPASLGYDSLFLSAEVILGRQTPIIKETTSQAVERPKYTQSNVMYSESLSPCNGTRKCRIKRDEKQQTLANSLSSFAVGELYHVLEK